MKCARRLVTVPVSATVHDFVDAEFRGLPDLSNPVRIDDPEHRLTLDG